MWTTSQAGINAMLGAADVAPAGQRRESALDALNAWLGSSIRLKLIQTSSGNEATRQERTHASGMTRVGEKLVAPTTGWTTIVNQSFQASSSPMRVRIERASDATRFVELAVGAGEAGSVSGTLSPGDTFAVGVLEITAFNIEDFEPADIPAPPASFLHRIYDNLDAPVTVQPSLVGMHFTDPDSIGGGVAFNAQHYITHKGWADTKGHASGPGGTFTTIKVTNTNASGSGSLRAALESSGARLIVFETSGVIDLAGAKVTVSNPYFTVAGQTAPSPGIAIIKGMVENATHNAIYSHLSFFAGTNAGSGQDCFESVGGTRNTIVDHCAFFWGRDGNIDIAGYPWNGSNVTEWRNNTSRQVTVSACVIAENFASGGMLIHDNSTDILTDRNYFYACRGRNGHYKGGTRGTSANNLIYNPQDKFFDNTLNLAGQSGDSTDTYESHIDLIGNVCKAGPDSGNVNALFELVSNEDCNLYLSDNEAKRTNGTDYPGTAVSNFLGSPLASINSSGAPNNTGHGATFMPRGAVVDWVMANVGPRPWDRHAQIARVLGHHGAGTGAHITNQSSVGGYPSLAANTQAFDPGEWDLETMTPTGAGVLDPAPVNVTLPAITGTPTVGQTLATSNGTWTGSPTPTYTYQWRRGASNISGGTSNTYLLVSADEGQNISCRVTATNTSGSANATSSAVGPVAAAGGSSGPDWYALIDATNPSAMYQGINLTGQPVIDGNRVGAVLDTSGKGNHWRAWDGDASRTEYKSAGGGYIEITDNYTRGMAIDGTNRLVDVRKAWWCVMAIKRGGPINAHAVLMDKDYSAGAPLGDQIAAGLEANGLFNEKLINDSSVGPIVSASAITTTTWGVVSFGYDGTNLTARVNLNTKGSVADTRPLPDEDGHMVLRLGGNTPSILHYKAVGFLDYYPGTAEESAAIAEIAALAGITL